MIQGDQYITKHCGLLGDASQSTQGKEHLAFEKRDAIADELNTCNTIGVVKQHFQTQGTVIIFLFFSGTALVTVNLWLCVRTEEVSRLQKFGKLEKDCWCKIPVIYTKKIALQ